MNEKEVIKKIKLLKKFQPSESDLETIKEAVLVKLSKQDTVNKGRSMLLYRFLFLLVFVILIAIFIFFHSTNPFLLRKIQLHGEIVLTHNAYEKAKLSLALSQIQLQVIQQRGSSRNDVTHLIASTSSTNTYFLKLHLHGEPGQYSEKQCKQLYMSFAVFIDTTQKTLHAIKDRSYDIPLQKIEKQVDSRLDSYKKRV